MVLEIDQRFPEKLFGGLLGLIGFHRRKAKPRGIVCPDMDEITAGTR